MKQRAAHPNNRSGTPWWSALLSLFVALALVAPPSHLCALMEMAPGHSHAGNHSHAAASSSAASGHAHSHENTSDAHDHDSDHHATVAAHKSNGAAVQTVPEPGACCSDSARSLVVAAAPSRFAAPAASSIEGSSVPATLPTALEIFALTNCHGRDGPSGSKPLPQLSCATLLGRAPPISA